jgi:hypothetical protein
MESDEDVQNMRSIEVEYLFYIPNASLVDPESNTRYVSKSPFIQLRRTMSNSLLSL